jgi:hypothetical protein
MLTIDEIKIEADEDGWHLIIHSDQMAEGGTDFRIGFPDQFLAETERTIGAWLAEGERAARQHQIDRGTAPSSRNVELDEAWPGDPDLARDIERGK